MCPGFSGPGALTGRRRGPNVAWLRRFLRARRQGPGPGQRPLRPSRRAQNNSRRAPRCTGRAPRCNRRAPRCTGRAPRCTGRAPSFNGRAPRCSRRAGRSSRAARRPSPPPPGSSGRAFCSSRRAFCSSGRAFCSSRRAFCSSRAPPRTSRRRGRSALAQRNPTRPPPGRYARSGGRRRVGETMGNARRLPAGEGRPRAGVERGAGLRPTACRNRGACGQGGSAWRP